MQDDKEPIFLEMILLDEKGTPLHAAVQKGMISRFSEMLQEGNIYAIKNIRISEANDTYKPVKGTIKGWFLQRTECDKINDQSLQIPRHYFEFTSYQDLLQRIGQKTLLIDIIGTLHGLGYEDDEVQVYGKPTKIRRLDLMLKGKEVVKVTLWRNIAMEFQQELQNHKEGTKTIAITSTIINTFRGECSINSTTSTRIYINISDPAFTDFKKGETSEAQEINEIPRQLFANNNPEKRMLHNRKSLQDNMSMKWESADQEKIFTIQGTIIDIDDTFGWSYIGCEICKRKLKRKKEGSKEEYNCEVCNRTSEYPTPRFRLQLKVSDDTTTTMLTMFDTDAQRLLNTTAADLLTVQHQNNGATPKQLQNLYNRKLIFEIKLSDYNLKEGSNNYTVTRAFIPNNILPNEALSKEIKKEPISPQQISSDEDTISAKEETTFDTKYNKKSTKQKVETIDGGRKLKGKLKKKALKDKEDILSSDEEPILIHSLRGKASKKQKVKGKVENEEPSQSA